MMQFKKMMVVDLECTCFQDDDLDKPRGWTADKDQEITEIGVSIVHLPNLEILETKSFLVQPEGPMGAFCKELTTLTFEDVKNRPILFGVLEELCAWAKSEKFDIKSMPWGSWGDYDRVQLFRECARKGLKYPFGRAHYNIKGLFSMLTGQGKGFGVSKALAQLGMNFDGIPHRGVDDARMTAKILLELLGKTR
jgi:inhibitor of KinA sporulation pathway (predicted exonuclease)